MMEVEHSEEEGSAMSQSAQSNSPKSVRRTAAPSSDRQKDTYGTRVVVVPRYTAPRFGRPMTSETRRGFEELLEDLEPDQKA